MVTTIKDDEGKVIAFCEWKLVGPSGFECQNGEYVWVNDLWIHENHRNNNLIIRIIEDVMRLAPSLKYGYFQRKAHNNKVRIYKKETWERRKHSLYSNIMEN